MCGSSCYRHSDFLQGHAGRTPAQYLREIAVSCRQYCANPARRGGARERGGCWDAHEPGATRGRCAGGALSALVGGFSRAQVRDQLRGRRTWSAWGLLPQAGKLRSQPHYQGTFLDGDASWVSHRASADDVLCGRPGSVTTKQPILAGARRSEHPRSSRGSTATTQARGPRQHKFEYYIVRL